MANEFTMSQKTIAEVCFVLSHPARVKIIELLSSNEGLRLKDITEQLQLSTSTTFQHLIIMRRAKIIGETKNQSKKRSKTYYITPLGKDKLIDFYKFVMTIV